MKIILFGASGMLGQGVLLEALDHPDVETVLAVVRRPSGRAHEKYSELIHSDFHDWSGVEEQITGHDVCLWCLGVSSTGMNEEAYTRITHDLTVAAGSVLARLNPGMTICFISGGGTDSSEQGRTMWARVKGKAENAVMKMPFGASYMFRPALVQPLRGVKSRTTAYRAFYTLMTPFHGVLRSLLPKYVTTTVRLGRAMLRVARDGADKQILENDDINALAD
jgi:uncharacterized protein YbjT (DUF2867 family)